MPDPFTLENLNALKQQILEVTHKSGHTGMDFFQIPWSSDGYEIFSSWNNKKHAVIVKGTIESFLVKVNLSPKASVENHQLKLVTIKRSGELEEPHYIPSPFNPKILDSISEYYLLSLDIDKLDINKLLDASLVNNNTASLQTKINSAMIHRQPGLKVITTPSLLTNLNQYKAAYAAVKPRIADTQKILGYCNLFAQSNTKNWNIFFMPIVYANQQQKKIRRISQNAQKIGTPVLFQLMEITGEGTDAKLTTKFVMYGNPGNGVWRETAIEITHDIDLQLLPLKKGMMRSFNPSLMKILKQGHALIGTASYIKPLPLDIMAKIINFTFDDSHEIEDIKDNIKLYSLAYNSREIVKELDTCKSILKKR